LISDIDQEQINKNKTSSDIKMQKDPFVYLFENFYISSKKNSVFQVKLVDKGIILKKESNGQSIKEQTIPLKFIIGSKVLRRSRRKKQTCSRTENQSCKSNNLRVVDENSENLDESDVSAYLYVYAYILKKQRHERTTITLRFRSFDKYEDNNREAQKWRTAIKCLLNDEKNIQPCYVPKDHRKGIIKIDST
jgi:sphingosine kinase